MPIVNSSISIDSTYLSGAFSPLVFRILVIVSCTLNVAITQEFGLTAIQLHTIGCIPSESLLLCRISPSPALLARGVAEGH